MGDVEKSVADELRSDRAIQGFCACWKIARLGPFGSALRADFGPESDIDIPVTFLEACGPPHAMGAAPLSSRGKSN